MALGEDMTERFHKKHGQKLQHLSILRVADPEEEEKKLAKRWEPSLALGGICYLPLSHARTICFIVVQCCAVLCLKEKRREG